MCVVAPCAQPPTSAAAEMLDSRLSTLRDMGFSVADAERALKACNNDVDAAVSKLTAARALEAERVFLGTDSPHDVLYGAADPYGTGKPRKRADPAPNDPNKGKYRDGLPDDVDPAEILDGRLTMFREMGFSIVDAERALEVCHNDVDAAVSKLMAARALEEERVLLGTDSPHDVLYGAADPYGSGKPRKRAEPAPNDPNKGKYRDGLGENADPAEILDYRFAMFREMGFSVADAERALEACRNDMDAALSQLIEARALEAEGAGSDSPHAVLAGSADPYGAGKPRKRAEPAANDFNKGHFRDGLSADAPPGAILDGRLGRFHEMGFDVEAAEQALRLCGNDVDRALTMLLDAAR